MAETTKATLHLKNGAWFDVVVDPEREFTPNSLTEKALHGFTIEGGKRGC